MVKIRLTRTGSTNDMCYRVVATDTRRPRDGRFLENLGWYDPKRKTDGVSINLDRIAYWKSKGAQLSDTVRSLVIQVKASPMVNENATPVATAPETVEGADSKADEQPAED